MQSHRRVQCGLAAKRRQDRVRLLFDDDGFDYFWGDRLDVGGVGEVRVGHDGRRVRVDQDHSDSLFAQHSAGLGARIVKFAGLADNDGPGSDN